MVIPHVSSRAVFRPDKMGKADLASADALFAGLNCFEPGQEHALHTHAGQDKLYYIVEGEGDVTVGAETTRVRSGDLVLARAEEPHAMANPGPGRLVVMVVMAPPPAKKA